MDCGVLDYQECSVDPHAIAGKPTLLWWFTSSLGFSWSQICVCALQGLWSHTCASCLNLCWPLTSMTSGYNPLSERVCWLPTVCVDTCVCLVIQECVCVCDFSIADQDKRLQALLNTCEKLPKANSDNFKWVSHIYIKYLTVETFRNWRHCLMSVRYLIKFLAKLNEFQDDNKMTPGNMAIVLGPNLLWANTEGWVSTLTSTHTCSLSQVTHACVSHRNITEIMTTVSLQIVGIIEPIIQHADWFFPGGEMHRMSDETSLF